MEINTSTHSSFQLPKGVEYNPTTGQYTDSRSRFYRGNSLDSIKVEHQNFLNWQEKSNLPLHKKVCAFALIFFSNLIEIFSNFFKCIFCCKGDQTKEGEEQKDGTKYNTTTKGN